MIPISDIFGEFILLGKKSMACLCLDEIYFVIATLFYFC